MRKRRIRIVLAWVAVLVIALLIRGWRQPWEPVYQGRSVTGWIKVLGEHERNDRLREDVSYRRYLQIKPASLAKGLATGALRAIGPPAVPYLTNVLGKTDPGLGGRYWKFFAGVNSRWGRLLPRPPVDSLCLRRAAVSALGEMMDVAKPAWPALLALETDADPMVRQRAAETLRSLSQRDAEVNTALSECLLTPGLPQAQVLQVVEKYALRSPKAIQAVIRAARDEPGEVRHAAINQLREIGRAAGDAASYLFSAPTETNRDIRRRGCQALGAIKPDAARTVPVLMAALDDSDALVRASAANALAVYGAKASAAVPRLTELFQTKDGVEKYCVARALTRIDPEAAAKLDVE